MDWYLAAYCETKQSVRVFRCDRILEAVLIKDEPFAIPSDFNLEGFWTDWANTFENTVKEEHPPSYSVRLELLDPGLAKLDGYDTDFSSLNAHVVSVNLYTYENACSVLSELGSKVKVLEPAELRDYVARQARLVLDIYAEEE
jgi:predicted DNA-binding transcriptional regulator YafY